MPDNTTEIAYYDVRRKNNISGLTNAVGFGRGLDNLSRQLQRAGYRNLFSWIDSFQERRFALKCSPPLSDADKLVFGSAQYDIQVRDKDFWDSQTNNPITVHGRWQD